jgi:hypothetical protein
MRRPVGWMTLAILVAYGCATPQTLRLVPVRPRAGLSASVPPASQAVVTASNSSARNQATVGILKQPASGTVPLKGTLKLDAGYLVNAGAGKVMLAGQQGARIAAIGGGRLVGNDAASLVGNDAASLVGNDAASLVGNDAASLVGNDSASLIVNDAGVVVSAGQGNVIAPLIANGGGNLIANGGGNLIANGGGNLIANGGGNAIARWSLLAEEGVNSATARLGEILPAVGMRLRVESTVDGRRVSLGEQANGEPVYEVFTNALGAFTVYVPENIAENVRVVAEPGALQDQRLRYDLLVAGNGQRAAELDEDSKMMMGMLRTVLGGYIRDGLESRGMNPSIRPDGDVSVVSNSTGDVNKDQLTAVRMELAALGEEIGFNRLSGAQKIAFGNEFADRAMAHVNLSAIRPFPDTFDEKISIVAMMVEDFQYIRREITTRIDRLTDERKDVAQFFNAQPWLQGAMYLDQTCYTIKKPADFCDFLTRHQLRRLTLDPRERANRFQFVCQEAGIDYPDTRRDRFAAVSQGLIMTLLGKYAFKDDDRQQMYKELRQQANSFLTASPVPGAAAQDALMFDSCGSIASPTPRE